MVRDDEMNNKPKLTVGRAAIAEHPVKTSKNCAPHSTDTSRAFFQPRGASGSTGDACSTSTCGDDASFLSSSMISAATCSEIVKVDTDDCDMTRRTRAGGKSKEIYERCYNEGGILKNPRDFISFSVYRPLVDV